MAYNTLTCNLDKYNEKKWDTEDRVAICGDGPLHRQISYKQILLTSWIMDEIFRQLNEKP